MIRFVRDDGGRARAGYRGIAGDCVARALTIIAGADYRTVYRDLARANHAAGGPRSARNGISKRAYPSVFEAYGLRKIPIRPGARLTFTEAHAMHGDCIVTTTKHVCALKGGALRDIYDCRTYPWTDQYGRPEMRERRAISIWRASQARRSK